MLLLLLFARQGGKLLEVSYLSLYAVCIGCMSVSAGVCVCQQQPMQRYTSATQTWTHRQTDRQTDRQTHTYSIHTAPFFTVGTRYHITLFPLRSLFVLRASSYFPMRLLLLLLSVAIVVIVDHCCPGCYCCCQLLLFQLRLLRLLLFISGRGGDLKRGRDHLDDRD